MSSCLFKVCATESLVSLGTSILVLVVMPQFDVLTNLFISGGVCTVSAILQIVCKLPEKRWKTVFPVCSLILIIAGNSLNVSCMSATNRASLRVFDFSPCLSKLKLSREWNRKRNKTICFPFLSISVLHVVFWTRQFVFRFDSLVATLFFYPSCQLFHSLLIVVFFMQCLAW